MTQEQRLRAWVAAVAKRLYDLHPPEEDGVFQLFIGWCMSQDMTHVQLLQYIDCGNWTDVEEVVLYSAVAAVIAIQIRRHRASGMDFTGRRPVYAEVTA